MPLMNLRVEQLDPASAADRNRMIKFAFKNYKRDPYWVPPLVADRKKFLDPKHNPSFEYLQAAYFVAEAVVIPENAPKGTITGGMEQDVGTIAAIYNPRHNEIHGDDIGFFGFFECINSQEVADALLDAAAAWLRGQGRSAMRGPLSFTMTDEVGLLIDGFNDMPRIMMPYNHPYYPELLEAYGLEKAMDLYAYHLDMKKLYGGTPAGLPPKLTRVVEKQVEKAKGPEVKITHWNGFTGYDRPCLENLMNLFNSFREDIEMEYTIRPWDGIRETLAPAWAAGEGPDFVLVPSV